MEKTVVITGSTSGIGNFLLKIYAEQGCKIFAGYRNEELRQELEKISSNVIPFYIDMAKKETVADAAKFILEKAEKIDTLLNVAGCVFAGAMECLSVERIREQFEVNTFAHLDLTQRLFSKLQGAKIINVSSMASFGVFPFVAPYCASKRALDILFNSMQIECGNDLKVVSIKPGVIKTPLWNKSISNNRDVLSENEKYRNEFNFLEKNAEKNSKKGLEAQAVANFIAKIDNLKNPKPSYTIGIDAKFAEILSHLPQAWINFLVSFSLQRRVKKAISSK